MKKLSLSTILIFSSLSLCYGNSNQGFQVTDATSLEYIKSVNSETVQPYDTIRQSNEVLVYSFSNDIDQDSASKLDAFMLTRSGIYSCVTDIVSKTTTFTIKPGLNSRGKIDELFEYGEHRFFY